MKKLSISILFLVFVFAFASCNTQKAENGDASETESDTTATSNADQGDQNQGITVTATEFPQFESSSLKFTEPAEGATLKSGTTRFNAEVNNYELGTQTENAENLMIANSDQGQHIHLIVDNDPYTAHYEPVFEREFSEGNHVVLAFLSRSYHASVKNKDAYVLRNYKVGNTAEESNFDTSKPHMFYSRPKGTYSGDDAQKVLLDFYLTNTELSPDGNKVRATINGREFMLDEWKPYIMEGLPMGEVTIKLELLDKDGNLVDSPFNPVERSITLEGGQQQQ